MHTHEHTHTGTHIFDKIAMTITMTRHKSGRQDCLIRPETGFLYVHRSREDANTETKHTLWGGGGVRAVVLEMETTRKSSEEMGGKSSRRKQLAHSAGDNS